MLGGVLILVRHGRTAANAEGRLQGRLDLELDEVGSLQATAVAELVLSTTTVDVVISSPLKRATQTAERFGMPFDVDESWIELAYGEWEGKTHSELPSEAWARWKENPGYIPEGGESLSALDERVRAACAAIAEQASRSNVVVVSHVSPMKSAVAWALDVGIGISWNCHLDHASVCRISFQGTRPVLETFNETAKPR